MIWPYLLGGSDVRFSTNLNDERSINWYPEPQKRGAKSPVGLLPTPGIHIFARAPEAPIRALFYQDGRAFFIAGDRFYELLKNGLYNLQGVVAQDQRPATIHTNGPAGHQLFIVSGGLGYIFDTEVNTFTQIGDPDFPANVAMGTFIDGYFIALEQDSITFWISELFNGLNWDGTDFGRVSESSNKIQSMIASHRELWLFGGKTTEVWANSGNASFPFQPVGGTFIEQGIIADFAASNLDNSIIWLGGDVNGSGVVYRADGYTPKRVSTHAVELAFQTYPRLDDSLSWTYQEYGHLFWVLYIPSADTSWVYDATLPPEIAWHERAHWQPRYMRWIPYRGRNHMFAFDKHLVGDRLSGTIYQMSHDFFDEQLALTV